MKIVHDNPPAVRRLPGWLPRYEVFRPYFDPHPDDATKGVFGEMMIVWGRQRAERLARRFGPLRPVSFGFRTRP